MGSWTLNIVLIRHFRGQVMLAAGLLFLLVPMYVLGADPDGLQCADISQDSPLHSGPSVARNEMQLSTHPYCCNSSSTHSNPPSWRRELCDQLSGEVTFCLKGQNERSVLTTTTATTTAAGGGGQSARK